MEESNHTLTILNLEDSTQFENKYENIVLWKSFSDDPNIFSIHEFIEANREKYKNIYTGWVASFQGNIDNGTELIDCLKLRSDFSYWWMTSFVEMQHYGRSSNIYNVVRLIAFEDWFCNFKYKIKYLNIISDEESKTFELLSQWAEKKGIEVNFININKDAKKELNLNSFLPRKTVAFIYLFYYIGKRFFNFIPKSKFNTDVKVSFWSYLNFNLGIEKQNKFKSIYWTELVNFVERNQIKTRWFHYYLEKRGIFSKRIFKQLNDKLKLFENQFNFHTLINGQLGFHMIMQIIKDYLKLNKFKCELLKFKDSFQIVNYSFNFWDLYELDFLDDFEGYKAMNNCILFNLFDELLVNSNCHGTGFYLFENCSWESAFIYSWKKGQNGKLFAIQHATVRFWDLRYFYPVLKTNILLSKPKPDFIGVNSEFSYLILNNVGYDESVLVKVEALRYLYLVENKKYIAQQFSNFNKNNILILGDYDFRKTASLLENVSKALKNKMEKYKLFFKPHPGSQTVYNFDKFGCEIIMISTELDKLFPSVKLVITSNVTSSILDAFFSNKIVATKYDADTFNMSPASGNMEINYFKNTKELEMIIESSSYDDVQYNRNSSLYFYLDENLTRWKTILFN